ncbi:MAG: iron-sulfur cluster assembly accessory protein, partial [Hyphomicrobiaceae bacterium]
AGMEYTMEWSGEQQLHDEVVEHNGAKVLIDPKAVMYLLGAEMDYQVDKLAAQFVFRNPNQSSACGCGESVNLTPATQDKLAALRS